jgi:hypothetical protein
MSRCKLKLSGLAINVLSLVILENLHWSESPITFDRKDHADSVPKLGRFPFIAAHQSPDGWG